MATATINHVNDANIAIEEENRKAVGDILNRVLSDLFVLNTKTRKYHWNVTGRLFYSLHKLLEEQYTAMDTALDEVAERARSVGAPAVGTLGEFLKITTLKEKPNDYPDAQTMLADLVADQEQVIRNLRTFVESTDEEYNDMGTSDFLTGLMEAHEKMAWMLRSFLEEQA